MKKVTSTVSALVVAALLNVSPISAAQTSSTGGFMIADIGRDTISMSKVHETLPTVLRMVPAEWTESQRTFGEKRIAVIKVDLAKTGALVRTSVLKSTGNRALDLNALAAVGDSTFSAGTVDGVNVGGTYAVTVEFNIDN